MSDPSPSYLEDIRMVEASLAGDNEAMTDIRLRYDKRLLGNLINRGASETEATDLLADLWGECVSGKPGKEPLFRKYHGKCALYTWMVTVSTHRLVDLKRRQKFQGELPSSRDEPDAGPDFDRLPAESERMPEDELARLMQAALKKALGEVTSEAYVLLQLVYIHGVMQREAAKMFGWHESKVSRTLDQAMSRIAARTVEEIKAVDPWLELSWQDFVELCANSDVLRFR
ncbi:MAG: sigma-70 family RNA polymerase sigma factor [Verrucomicrobiota bacterium]